MQGLLQGCLRCVEVVILQGMETCVGTGPILTAAACARSLRGPPQVDQPVNV